MFDQVAMTGTKQTQIRKTPSQTIEIKDNPLTTSYRGTKTISEEKTIHVAYDYISRLQE